LSTWLQDLPGFALGKMLPLKSATAIAPPATSVALTPKISSVSRTQTNKRGQALAWTEAYLVQSRWFCRGKDRGANEIDLSSTAYVTNE